MFDIVIDASAALSWCYEDEQNLELEKLLLKIANGLHACAPSIWMLEVYNSLCVAHRRDRINWEQLTEKVQLLSNLGIRTLHESSNLQSTDHLLKLCKKYHLSSYDASYLLLAKQQNIPIASLDKRLRKAATHEKLSLIPK